MQYIVLDMEWNQPWPGSPSAKKVLPRNWNVRAGEALVTTLSEMLGEKNVKVVEKPLGKISS